MVSFQDRLIEKAIEMNTLMSVLNIVTLGVLRKLLNPYLKYLSNHDYVVQGTEEKLHTIENDIQSTIFIHCFLWDIARNGGKITYIEDLRSMEIRYQESTVVIKKIKT